MKNSHLLRAIACMLFLAAGSANACSVDVESTGVEFAGKDMLLSFRIAPETDSATTVNFTVSVRYMSDGTPRAEAYSFSQAVSGNAALILPATTQFDVTEISSVQVNAATCSL